MESHSYDVLMFGKCDEYLGVSLNIVNKQRITRAKQSRRLSHLPKIELSRKIDAIKVFSTCPMCIMNYRQLP